MHLRGIERDGCPSQYVDPEGVEGGLLNECVSRCQEKPETLYFTPDLWFLGVLVVDRRAM